LLQGCDLADCSAYFDLFAACDCNVTQEAHLKLSLIINLKELLETFLENRVSKRVSHDVKATCLFEAWLHFQDTNLINCCHEHINHDSCLLRSVSKTLVKLDGVLQVLCVFLFLLDVKMRSDSFFQGLADNHAWSESDGSSHEGDNSRSA
jgi:hypothetical protein